LPFGLIKAKSRHPPFFKEAAMARPSKLASMSIEALFKMRDDVNAVLTRKADELEGQLAKIAGNGWVSSGSAKRRANGKSLKGRKVAPKYRSKKDPNLTWAGRGATPVWMRDEMNTKKLKKEAFLIK
jgi:DNA-binding protein H-NS